MRSQSAALDTSPASRVVGALALSIGVVQPFAQVRAGTARRGGPWRQRDRRGRAAGRRGQDRGWLRRCGTPWRGRQWRRRLCRGRQARERGDRRGTRRRRAAVGRRGAVVVGEEGAAAVGRHGNVVVADRYESYDAWKAVAAVGAGIAIGTMLAKPPAAAAPVVVESSTYYVHDNVYYTRVVTGGEVAYQVVGPAAWRHHHHAAGRLHQREGQRGDLLAVRPDALHKGVDGISGRRPEVTSEVVPADARTHVAWRAAASRGPAARRRRRPGDADQNVRPESLEGRRLRDVLDDRRRRPALGAGIRHAHRSVRRKSPSRRRSKMRRAAPRCCPTTPRSRGWPAGWSIANAGTTGRSTRSASRRGAPCSRPAPWRRSPTAFETSCTVWTRLLHPAPDEDGVADAVLTLTAIILLLRPLDVWWLTPFILAAACLSVLWRGVRRAPLTWIVVALLVAARIAVVWPLSDNHIYLLAYWCLAIGLALAGPCVRDHPGHEQSLAARCRVRDGGAVEGRAVAGLRGRPLLQGHAADRRAVRRCGAAVWRALGRADDREPQVPRAVAGRRAAAHPAGLRRAAASARVRVGGHLGRPGPGIGRRRAVPDPGRRDGPGGAARGAARCSAPRPTPWLRWPASDG